jgi:hypothetical protein
MKLSRFINDLIKNINIDNVPREIDLVLDGGAFNGAFQLGALMYLKQMEKNNIIKIKRISGTSIGAILGFLFIIDRLEYALEKNYEIWRNFRKNFNLSVVREMIIELINTLDKEIYKNINKKLFITYFNVNKKKQIIKSTFKNNKQVESSIIKSSFVPYFIDGKYTYKNKYIDGIYPYIFKKSGEKNRKILFISLTSDNQFCMMMSIKNEVNGHERVLHGIININNFFKKKIYSNNSTLQMCSYVNNWNCIVWARFRSRYIFLIFILYIIDFYKRFNFNIYNNSIINNNSVINNILFFIKRRFLSTLKNSII